MSDTFRISFLLKNTYRVNCIIFAIKQFPFIGKRLPVTLYKNRGIKIFATILAILWEVLSTFLGKALYVLLMISLACGAYKNVASGEAFLHILFFLSIGGAYLNTFLFNPTNDKYYAMILMRMDAKSYTLSNYLYEIAKLGIGFFAVVLFFGLANGLPIWICIMVPFVVIAMKVFVAWRNLCYYQKTGICLNENLPPKVLYSLVLAVVAAAYVLPSLGIVITYPVFFLLAVVILVMGMYSLWKVLQFDEYREMYQILLAEKKNGLSISQIKKDATKEQTQKAISVQEGITSHKIGFEYLNELFIKRHHKVLWKSSKWIAFICLLIEAVLMMLLYRDVEAMKDINQVLMQSLPYFVFIMYMINRGTIFTQYLFMNCDHCMLTYSFYKEPSSILKLFQIRLREIIKINLLPAVVIGFGLSVFLYLSGGTENPLNYMIMPVSIMAMSIFFSVHYLTWYYLLQPYNIESEMKSSTYIIITWATYFVCFGMMQLKVPTTIFCSLMIAFCILYCIIASVLVYKFAHKTFRIRK